MASRLTSQPPPLPAGRLLRGSPSSLRLLLLLPKKPYGFPGAPVQLPSRLVLPLCGKSIAMRGAPSFSPQSLTAFRGPRCSRLCSRWGEHRRILKQMKVPIKSLCLAAWGFLHICTAAGKDSSSARLHRLQPNMTKLLRRISSPEEGKGKFCTQYKYRCIQKEAFDLKNQFISKIFSK